MLAMELSFLRGETGNGQQRMCWTAGLYLGSTKVLGAGVRWAGGFGEILPPERGRVRQVLDPVLRLSRNWMSTRRRCCCLRVAGKCLHPSAAAGNCWCPGRMLEAGLSALQGSPEGGEE